MVAQVAQSDDVALEIPWWCELAFHGEFSPPIFACEGTYIADVMVVGHLLVLARGHEKHLDLI